MLLSAGIERVHIWKAASGVRLPETEGGQSARENGNPCSPALPVGAHCLVRRRSYLSLVLEGLSRDSRSLWAYLEARSAGSAGPGTEALCPGLPGCPTAPRPPPPSCAAWPAPGCPPSVPPCPRCLLDLHSALTSPACLPACLPCSDVLSERGLCLPWPWRLPSGCQLCCQWPPFSFPSC